MLSTLHHYCTLSYASKVHNGDFPFPTMLFCLFVCCCWCSCMLLVRNNYQQCRYFLHYRIIIIFQFAEMRTEIPDGLLFTVVCAATFQLRNRNAYFIIEINFIFIFYVNKMDILLTVLLCWTWTGYWVRHTDRLSIRYLHSNNNQMKYFTFTREMKNERGERW